jgi:hypothetical protein
MTSGTVGKEQGGSGRGGFGVSIQFRSYELITAKTLSRYQHIVAEIRIGYKHFDPLTVPSRYGNLLCGKTQA